MLNRLNNKRLTIRQKLSKSLSRSLTIGERSLAYSVFGDALYLDEVRIETAWWVLKNYAVSPNGNIYFHPDNWTEDFSNESLPKQAWLIHELTHVWQIQQGLKIVRKALFDRRYDYVLTEGKSFFKYGIEQQARMVENYFIKMRQGDDCEALKACIPFLEPANHAIVEEV